MAVEDKNFITRISPKNQDIIVKDSRRTFAGLISDKDKLTKQQDRLERLLFVFFSINTEYEYYQGFHDIVAILTLLKITDEEVLFYTDKLTRIFFHKFLDNKRFSDLLLNDINTVIEDIWNLNKKMDKEKLQLVTYSRLISEGEQVVSDLVLA